MLVHTCHLFIFYFLTFVDKFFKYNLLLLETGMNTRLLCHFYRPLSYDLCYYGACTVFITLEWQISEGIKCWT